MNETDYFTWRDYGIDKGWISPPVCYTHDSIQMSDEEVAELDDDNDICFSIFRIWEDAIERSLKEKPDVA